MAWQPDNVGLMTEARGPCSLGSRVEAAHRADSPVKFAGTALRADIPTGPGAWTGCDKAC